MNCGEVCKLNRLLDSDECDPRRLAAGYVDSQFFSQLILWSDTSRGGQPIAPPTDSRIEAATTANVSSGDVSTPSLAATASCVGVGLTSLNGVLGEPAYCISHMRLPIRPPPCY